MPSLRRRPGRDAPFVWDAPAPTMRATLSPLDRDRIVEAAVGLADREGLAAVSLRRVGAALDAGPMRLYNFVATKEDLLELMVDAVYGEMVADGPFEGNWRDALRAVAERTRAAAERHPWVVELLGIKAHLGPNALAHLEACLAALRATSKLEGLDAVLQAIQTLNAYVIGAMRTEALAPKPRWREPVAAPYLTRMFNSGQFPNVAVAFKQTAEQRGEEAFKRGVECILDGVDFAQHV